MTTIDTGCKQWSEWGECSGTPCELGASKRTRKCLVDGKYENKYEEIDCKVIIKRVCC